MSRLIGGHVSGAGGIKNALARGDEIGAEIIQIFTNSPRGWKAQPISLNGFDDISHAKRDLTTKVSKVVSHASYLINLASPEPELYAKSRALLAQTMTYASEIGVSSVVLHVGSHRGHGFNSQFNQIVEAIAQAIEIGPKTQLLLENSAGAGDSIGSTFNELGSVLQASALNCRVGVCLDTQHLFASGVEFTNDGQVEAIATQIRDQLPKDALGLIHLNDSKVACGARVDRHENIGEGFIGNAPLARLLTHSSFQDIDIVLECPGDGDGPRAIDVTQARDLFGTFQS